MNSNLFTVNVIEKNRDDILQLVAFPETVEGNEKAENLFRQMVLENYPSLQDAYMDNCLEDGCFSESDFSVLLVHST